MKVKIPILAIATLLCYVAGAQIQPNQGPKVGVLQTPEKITDKQVEQYLAAIEKQKAYIKALEIAVAKLTAENTNLKAELAKLQGAAPTNEKQPKTP